jgi:hypothetical protein
MSNKKAKNIQASLKKKYFILFHYCEWEHVT